MGSGSTDGLVRGIGPDEVPAPAGLVDLVERWLPDRRWYPAKGSTQPPPLVAVVPLVDPRGEATVRVELRRLPAGGLLQVPLVLRGAAVDEVPDAAVVGTLADGTVVVDGAQDPAFWRAWLAVAEGPLAGGDVELAGLRALTGEQSNTSVILPSAEPPAIAKVFRALGSGANPDVEVPLALSGTGWRGVPRPLAWVTASWPGQGSKEGPAVDGGHLGVLSELVVGAQDGFELACRQARDDEDLGPLAHELGRTTAQMHAALRAALPVAEAGAGAAGVVGTLRERAAAAVAAAPVLTDRRDAVERVLARVAGLDLPPLQRVHGDYHLGQVLRAPERGWVVLDFEGEPQAPAAERTRPDLALRDLAGMLRSMDYAAAVGQGSAAWAESARTALVAGYLEEAREDGAPGTATAAGGDVDVTTATLLHALELDKALYEVVYESRNRPDWVAIPLGGVDRLLDAA